MSTIVCNNKNCPLRSNNNFCTEDIVILDVRNGIMMCKNMVLYINELEYERMMKNAEVRNAADNTNTSNDNNCETCGESGYAEGTEEHPQGNE